MVSVRKSGKHVTNSPFKIVVGPSEIGDASRVKVWGAGLAEGRTFQLSDFIVDTRSAGGHGGGAACKVGGGGPRCGADPVPSMQAMEGWGCPSRGPARWTSTARTWRTAPAK